MSVCVVSGTLVDASATAVSGAVLTFRTIRAVLDSSFNLVLPVEVSTTSSSLGAWSLSLDQGISGVLTVSYPPSDTTASRLDSYSLTIPAQSTATFASLMPTET